MPHHKSAEKRLRQSAKRRTQNRAVRSELRSTVKAARGAAAAKKSAHVPLAYASLDRAAKKRVIPKARAARLKSRIAKTANRASG